MTNQNLHDLRNQSGKTIMEVAQELHTTVRIIERYEDGTRALGIMRVIALAKVYGCTVEEVVKAQKNTCKRKES